MSTVEAEILEIKSEPLSNVQLALEEGSNRTLISEKEVPLMSGSEHEGIVTPPYGIRLLDVFKQFLPLGLLAFGTA